MRALPRSRVARNFILAWNARNFSGPSLSIQPMAGLSAPVRYAADVPLFACPFCREMFEKREARRARCAACPSSPFEKLPPSAEALDEDGIPAEPEREPLSRHLPRAGARCAGGAGPGRPRRLLPSVGPPHDARLVASRAFDLAQRLGWAWGAGVAWFVLFPTVLTRRTIMQMRGARVAASFLAAVPGMTAALLLARPPHGAHGVPAAVHLRAWRLYATLGPLAPGPRLRAVLRRPRGRHPACGSGTSAGQVVH